MKTGRWGFTLVPSTGSGPDALHVIFCVNLRVQHAIGRSFGFGACERAEGINTVMDRRLLHEDGQVGS